MSSSNAPFRPLCRATIADDFQQLVRMDPLFAILDPPAGAIPLWKRAQGFETLIRIVLEQQVSLAAGGTMHRRLKQACGGRINAASITAMQFQGLRANGITTQKAKTMLGLADASKSRKLRLASLTKMNATAIRTHLTQFHGIGPWTAEVYLMMALLHPDAFPPGDMALVLQWKRLLHMHEHGGTHQRAIRAYQTAASLRRGDFDEMMTHAGSWQPFRGTAARYLWHVYLHAGKESAG